MFGIMASMGLIDRGDEELHYSDHSHRWTAPPDIDQELWEVGMRAHLARHRSGAVEQPQPSPRDGTVAPVTGAVPPPTR
jgi:hypothetical protein